MYISYGQLVGGWTNPSEKYLIITVKLDNFPNFRDEN